MYQLNVREIWDTEPSCNKANCQDCQDSFSISRTMKLSQKIRNIEVFDGITLGSYNPLEWRLSVCFRFRGSVAIAILPNDHGSNS